MKDPKTTITAYAKAIIVLLGAFGVVFNPEETKAIVATAGSVYATLEIIFGHFAKDK